MTPSTSSAYYCCSPFWWASGLCWTVLSAEPQEDLMPAKAATAAAAKDVSALVTEALSNPDEVIESLRSYTELEEQNAHQDLEMSILRYALAGHITGALEGLDIPDLSVEPFDTTVSISGANKPVGKRPGKPWTMEVAYPDWLKDFFGPDDACALLEPHDERTLDEALDLMAEATIESDDEDEEDEDSPPSGTNEASRETEEDLAALDSEDPEAEEADEDEDDDELDEDEDEDEDEDDEQDEEDEEDEEEDEARAESIPLPHEVRAADARYPASW